MFKFYKIHLWNKNTHTYNLNVFLSSKMHYSPMPFKNVGNFAKI